EPGSHRKKPHSFMNVDPGEERSAPRETQPGPAKTPRSPRLRVTPTSALSPSTLCELRKPSPPAIPHERARNLRALAVRQVRGGDGERALAGCVRVRKLDLEPLDGAVRVA